MAVWRPPCGSGCGARIKEFVLKGVGRVDFIDLEKKITYELKPNNPRAIQEGVRLIQTYKAGIERLLGPGFLQRRPNFANGGNASFSTGNSRSNLPGVGCP